MFSKKKTNVVVQFMTFLLFFEGNPLIILIVMGRLICRAWCQIFWMKQIHRTVTILKGMLKVNVLTVWVVCVLLLTVVKNQKFVILKVYITNIILYAFIYVV